jgi:glycine hydroxymethyltransferase
VGASLVADAAQTIGLVAGGVIASPVPYADVVCGVTHKVLGGPRGGLLLCREELAERVDRAVFPFTQGGPAVNQMAAKALVLGRRLLTGGTDTHLVTADARGLGLTGREAERRCEAVGLLIGRCAVPFDEVPPAEACGVRLGTACVTSRGMGPEQMAELAALLGRALRCEDGDLAERVRALARRCPVDDPAGLRQPDPAG